MSLIRFWMVLCASAWAQIQLAPTVVTASALEENADLASQRVRLVTRAEIEASSATNVQQLIVRLPGIHLQVHPATPNFAQVSLEGLGGSAVKVLIDGVEVAGDIGGVTSLELIPVADVERIEILEGASSVLYGSDALGGVINIITRTRHARGDLRQELSSNGTLSGSVRKSWQNQQTQYRISSSYLWDNGSTQSARNPFGEGVNLYPVPPHSSQLLRLSSDWVFGKGRLGYSSSIRHNALTIRDATMTESDYKDLALEATLYGKMPASSRSNFEGDLSVQQFRHQLSQRNLDWNTDLGSQQSVDQEQQANLRWVWRKDSWNTVLLGAFANYETLRSKDFPKTQTATTVDFYAQDMISLFGEDHWLLVPALRYSSQVAMESAVLTPKFSLRYAPDTTKVFRASYGMGYRRPTLKQKYWVLFHQAPFNFLLKGNPDLKPEQSQSIHFSFENRPVPQFFWSASIFGNYLFDMIDDVVVDPNEGTAIDPQGNAQPYMQVRSYANVNKAFTAGGSLELGSRYGNCQSMISYAYLYAKAQIDGKYQDMLLQVPHSVRLEQSYRYPRTRTSLKIQGIWNDKQLVAVVPRQYSPDFLQFDFSLWQEIRKSWQVFLGIENILDNKHPQMGNANLIAHDQETYYGMFDGRTLRCGAKFSF